MTDEITEEVQTKRTRKTREKADDHELVAIILKKNYRPGGEFLIERDGDIQEPGINDDGGDDRDKVKAGVTIHIPRAEARRAIKLGIAERADEI